MYYNILFVYFFVGCFIKFYKTIDQCIVFWYVRVCVNCVGIRSVNLTELRLHASGCEWECVCVWYSIDFSASRVDQVRKPTRNSLMQIDMESVRDKPWAPVRKLRAFQTRSPALTTFSSLPFPGFSTSNKASWTGEATTRNINSISRRS